MFMSNHFFKVTRFLLYGFSFGASLSERFAKRVKTAVFGIDCNHFFTFCGWDKCFIRIPPFLRIGAKEKVMPRAGTPFGGARHGPVRGDFSRRRMI